MMKSFLRRGRSTALAGGLALTGAVLAQGCLQREVNPQKPNTSNVFVEQIANTSINEIDLLFVIDNSVSMADKQDILKLAVPEMVKRLVSPLCVDDDGNPVGGNAASNGECASGKAEFTPVDDIHIGVITSSLGGHGSPDSCLRGEANVDSPSGFWDNDDQGYLIANKRSNATAKGEVTEAFPGGAGFLAWNGGTPEDADSLIADFTEHVDVAGEFGCGFEAPLEAWYRFLVDPQPPAEIVKNGEISVSTGLDELLLAQRDAFLRPQGLVAIVVLTDENDCSVMDGGSYYNNAGFGYLMTTTQNFLMPVATSICETNPNAPCCFSCLQRSNPPADCGSFVSECDGSPAPKLDAASDRANARCFENKRRFGVDLLYPVSRYVDALSKPKIVDARSNETVDNPLLRGSGVNAGKPRDPGLVFFAGIVGVPWQDIATEDSLDPANSTMRYLTSAQLSQKNIAVGDRNVDRWEVILGQPGLAASSKRCDDDVAGCGVQPKSALDPFMIESITPRIGNDVYGVPFPLANPISNDPIVEVMNNNPRANGINGHEANHSAESARLMGPANDDLQYACIFELAEEARKTDCVEGSGSCDCGDEPARNRPLCQPPTGGVAEKNQYYGKAYPGTRILQVLKEFGANSIVGSICPKITTGSTSASGFGYNPAVQAIVDRLAEKLSGKCLPRELSIDEEGDVPCAVVEAKPLGADEPLNCAAELGRQPVNPDIRPAVEKQLADTGFCDGESDVLCSTYDMCEIIQLPRGSAGRTRCFTDTGDAATFSDAGYCYIDPAKGPEAGGEGCDADNPDSWASCTNGIVANCPATERRLLRFAGANTPASNSITFVACTGDAASSDAAIPGASAVTGGGGATN